MLRNLMILSFIYWFNLSCARPAEEPTKFTLSTVGSDTENFLTSRLEQGQELLGRAADAIRIARGRFINSLLLARNIIVDITEQIMANEARNNLGTANVKSNNLNQQRRSLTVQSTTPLILFRSMQRETVRLENETAQAILEKPTPDNVRQIFNSFLMPTPIVDGIQEKEKYGNTGARFAGIGRAVVNSYENLSNFLNTIVDIPRNVAKQTSRGITEVLNKLGARIIGLE